MGRLVLGVYATPYADDEVELRAYHFKIGPPAKLEAHSAENHELINTVKLPPKLLLSLQKAGTLGKNEDEVISLGYLTYQLWNGTAYTAHVHPKDSIPPEKRRSVKGLGYLAELLATSDLKKRGVTSISTTRSPSTPRKKQLDKVGLEIDEETPLKEWLRGMARGARTQFRPSIITRAKKFLRRAFRKKPLFKTRP